MLPHQLKDWNISEQGSRRYTADSLDMWPVLNLPPALVFQFLISAKQQALQENRRLRVENAELKKRLYFAGPYVFSSELNSHALLSEQFGLQNVNFRHFSVIGGRLFDRGWV